MGSKRDDEIYSEQETVARREAALKRMLSTPHKPHKPLGKKKSATEKSKPKGANRATWP